MNNLAINELRSNLAEYLNRVTYCKERMTLTRKGKQIAAIVPIEDLRLIEILEDKIDLLDAELAMKEPGSISWEKIKKELDM